MRTLNFITEWVTQIIIFILIAAIIDLLMPKSTMKKYIKFVVSLILLLIFLRPVFVIFNIDMARELETSITEALQMDDYNDSIENSTNFKKDEIQALQDAYILKELQEQLIQIANEPLRENFSVEIIDIEFTFYDGQTLSYESLQSLAVHIQSIEHTAGTIQAVEEIVIFENEQERDDESENNEKKEDIKQFLMIVWEVHDKEIEIIWP